MANTQNPADVIVGKMEQMIKGTDCVIVSLALKSALREIRPELVLVGEMNTQVENLTRQRDQKSEEYDALAMRLGVPACDWRHEKVLKTLVFLLDRFEKSGMAERPMAVNRVPENPNTCGRPEDTALVEANAKIVALEHQIGELNRLLAEKCASVDVIKGRNYALQAELETARRDIAEYVGCANLYNTLVERITKALEIPPCATMDGVVSAVVTRDQQRKQLQRELATANQDTVDLQKTFELQQSRLNRATSLWRSATGQHGVMPDLGALMDWLMFARLRQGSVFSGGVAAIMEERDRQVADEDYDEEHDDMHGGRLELMRAAEAYLTDLRVRLRDPMEFKSVPECWPWGAEQFKPTRDGIRQLVKAGALIAAEIDRRLRASKTVSTCAK